MDGIWTDRRPVKRSYHSFPRRSFQRGARRDSAELVGSGELSCGPSNIASIPPPGGGSPSADPDSSFLAFRWARAIPSAENLSRTRGFSPPAPSRHTVHVFHPPHGTGGAKREPPATEAICQPPSLAAVGTHTEARGGQLLLGSRIAVLHDTASIRLTAPSHNTDPATEKTGRSDLDLRARAGLSHRHSGPSR